jgi:hypothetical protein
MILRKAVAFCPSCHKAQQKAIAALNSEADVRWPVGEIVTDLLPPMYPESATWIPRPDLGEFTWERTT